MTWTKVKIICADHFTQNGRTFLHLIWDLSWSWEDSFYSAAPLTPGLCLLKQIYPNELFSIDLNAVWKTRSGCVWNSFMVKDGCGWNWFLQLLHAFLNFNFFIHVFIYLFFCRPSTPPAPVTTKWCKDELVSFSLKSTTSFAKKRSQLKKQLQET